MSRKRDWRLWLPYLDFYLELPLILIRTQIMRPELGYGFEYVALEVRLWKWEFRFALYDTRRRSVEREGETDGA